MKKRRSRLEIKIQMLRLLKSEALIQTDLMYRCNLNGDLVTDNIQQLVEAGLIAWDPVSRTYHILQKGLDCLARYDAFQRMM